MKTKTIYLLAAIIISFNAFAQQYQFHLERNIDIYGKPVKSTIQKNLKGDVAEVFTFYCLTPQESAEELKYNLDRKSSGSHGFVVKYNKEGWKIATASLKDSMDIYKPSEWIEYEVIDNMPEFFIIESIFINRHKYKFEYKRGRLKKVYELDDGVWEIEAKVKCDREGRIKKYDRSGDGSPHKYFYSNEGEMLIIKEYSGGYNYYNKMGFKSKRSYKE